MSALVLHNFLRKSTSRNVYCPSGLCDEYNKRLEMVHGTWRTESQSLLELEPISHGNNQSINAKNTRDILKNYFMNEDAVEWQWERV